MSRIKFVLCSFREYEGASFATFLEKMAAKGWFAEQKIFGSLWRFRKGEPAKRRYYAAVMPGSSEFMTEESGETRDYRELCEEAGWKLECGDIIWQIFYTEEEDTVPIETDPQLRLETIKGILVTPWTAAGDWMIAAFLAGIALWSLLRGNVGEQLEQQIGIAVLLLMSMARIARRVRIMSWYRAAKKRVSSGEEIPETPFESVRMRGRLNVLGTVGVLLLALWSTPLFRTLIFIMFLDTFYSELLCFLIENRGVLRRNGSDGKNGKAGERARVILIVLCLTLFFGWLLSFDLIKRVLPSWQETGVETQVESL